MDIYQVRLTFSEPLLGTVPLDREVYTTYVKSLGKNNDDEGETLPDVDGLIEKGTTGFHEQDGKPILYDYAIKGFFKDVCSMLRYDSNSRSAGIKNYKKAIDGLVFVYPRQIPIELAGETFVVERPLRAQTARGERVALSRSIAVPAGSSLAFEIQVIAVVSQPLLEEWLMYGRFRGLGQWRNGGYGRFEYTLKKQS